MRRTYLIPSRASQPLYIVTSSPLPNGTQGVPYSFAMTANGGTAPYTWSSGLVNGLVCSISGVVFGVPVNAEVDSLPVTVTDSTGAHVTGSFQITTNAAGGTSPWTQGTVNGASLNWADVKAAA